MPQQPPTFRVSVPRARIALLFAVFAVIASTAPDRTAVAVAPTYVDFDAEINGGAAIPPAGTPVLSDLVLHVSTPASDPAPTNTELPDYLEFRLGGIELQKAPGLPGGMPAAGIGAQTGEASGRIETAKILPLFGYGWLATSVQYAGLVPECGDNRWAVRTRDYLFPNGPGPEDDQWSASFLTPSFVGNMSREADTVNGAGAVKNRPDALVAGAVPAWNAAQYADETNTEPADQLFIQAYDDDNNNGFVDSFSSDPGSAASKTEPVVGSGLADPFVAVSTGTYRPGTPQTQNDYDQDGIPNGVEYMPDSLPVLVDRLGLTDSWVYRGYGAVLTWLSGPIDVHVLGFRDAAPGSPTRFIVILGNPLAPADVGLPVEARCAPMTLRLKTFAAAVAPNYGRGVVPSVQAGAPVQVVASGGALSVDALISDIGDFDMDGVTGPVDLCATDGPANDDPDNDLVSSSCDVDGSGSKTTKDWDGDGWQNNTDNCPSWFNPQQLDRDDDTVGDIPVCDPLVVRVGDEWNGKGNGSATSLLFDNDLVCSDTYSTTEAFGDVVIGCTSADDANDDGEPDAADCDSNEDGDLLADCADAEPLNPLNGSDGDFDNDGCTDAQELGPDPGLGGQKMPFNWWDNYDVTLDGGVDLSDTLDLLAFFGAGPDDPGVQERDRALPWPAKPAVLIEADDGIDLTDALNSLAQFGFGCGGVPEAPPATGEYIGG